MQKHSLNVLYFLALLIGLTACSTTENHEVHRAFYFWENRKINTDEVEQFQEFKSDKLYLKLFEIERDEIQGTIPIAKYYASIPQLMEGVEIIPCVYIQNEVMAQSTNEQLDQLADNTVFLINKYLNEKLLDDAQKKIECSEIQIDCDWLASNKEQYFYFLKAVKKYWQQKVSCTLRLYPYKFTQDMGVPPVDRAMLLCYNLLDPRSHNKQNSILDLNELQKYIQTDQAYPLPMDIALPVYSTCYKFSNVQFDELSHQVPLELESLCTPDEDGLWYTVNQDTILNYQYFKMGQRLKIERVSSELLLEAAEMIRDKVKTEHEMTVALYHLNKKELNNYSNETINAVYQLFE